MKAAWLLLLAACLIGISVFVTDLFLQRAIAGAQSWLGVYDSLVAVAGLVVLGLIAFNYARRSGAAVARITRLNDMLRAVRDADHIIAHETNPARLIQRICRTLIETRGYLFAWAMQTDESGRILALAQAGEDQMPEAMRNLRDAGKVPESVADCMSRPGAVVTRTPRAQCPACPVGQSWTGTVMCCRLEHVGKVHGLLSVCTKSGAGEDGEEQALFAELAENVGLALGGLDQERRRAETEEALAKEQGFIYAVLQAAGALVAALDREGKIVHFNRACEELTGYSLVEARGRRLWDLLILPEEVESVKAVFADLQAGRFPDRHENWWRTKDGRCKLIAWNNTALLDREGSVEYVIKTGIEITEQRRAELALDETNAGYRNLVEQIPAITYMAKLEEGGAPLSYVSPQVQEFLGVSPAEYLNDPEKWIHPEDRRRVKNERAKSLQSRTPFVCDYRMVSCDGRAVRFHDRATLVLSEKGQPLFLQGVMFNVPQRAPGGA